MVSEAPIRSHPVSFCGILFRPVLINYKKFEKMFQSSFCLPDIHVEDEELAGVLQPSNKEVWSDAVHDPGFRERDKGSNGRC